MVKKPEIQYIDKFYVHGSEAQVLELKPKKRLIRTVLPVSAPDKTIRIPVDPVAICGIVVAVALMVALVLGTVQYVRVCREYRSMMDYVVTVQNKNVVLRESYKSQMNLEAVEQRALELGMIPIEQADKITIRPELPVPEPEMTIWDEIEWFCKELFA